MEQTIAVAVHGGLGSDLIFLKSHLKETEQGLILATETSYEILKCGGSALDAVEAAVKILEDDPHFNAGRGSALNCRGEIEMDASIMDGNTLKAGAICLAKNIKNPISLARAVMNKTKHVFLAGYGAHEIAKLEKKICVEADSYFITQHQYEAFKKERDEKTFQDILKKRIFGTVGAVALDRKGNLASATSTGGTTNCLAGRIGDSCVIGAGCYANNNSCAVSCTGEGEFIITGVIANTIALMNEFEMSLQEACDHVIHIRNNDIKKEMGAIAVDRKGEIGFTFNTETMSRAWMSETKPLEVKIFK